MNDNSVIEPVEFSRAGPVTRRHLSALRPLTLAVGAAFILLAIAALFMLNARAVQIISTPVAGNVSITGSFPSYELGGRYLMIKGDYEISIVHDGYKPLVAPVSVGNDPEQIYSFDLTRLPGIVEFKVLSNTRDAESAYVEGAEIYIDQELQGRTPLLANEVEAGTRDIYVRHPRYQPWQSEIEVEGYGNKQTEQIELLPAWAKISINTDPVGAEVYVDEVLKGTTPLTVELIEGIRSIRLNKTGYKSWEGDVEVESQVDQALGEIVLPPSDGKLNVVTRPTGANITISGTYYGKSPLSVELPPGKDYELLATRAGYKTARRSFNIEPEQDQSINLSLPAETGVIKLSVNPADASLFVNGTKRGEANQTLALPARSHDIRIELAGYASYTASVIPQPGFPQQFNVTLQTEEEARVSAIPQRIQTSLGDTLRFIIPGNLRMGAGRREPGRRSNEIQKTVSLTRPFYLGEFEISNATFKAFRPTHDSGLLGRALLTEDDRPVVNVSWEDVVQFCNWLSEKEGLAPAYEFTSGIWKLKSPFTTGYRLPTEAEWAWAARYAGAGDAMPTRFPWGDSMPPPPGSGNFADVSAINMAPYSLKNYNDNFRGPAPSGSFAPNKVGIYDLAGNVSEWISDYYAVETVRETLIDPTGPQGGEYHVVRGSNYTHGRFGELRWTWRDYGTAPRPDVGFRLARYVE